MKTAHISFDDVWLCLNDINRKKYKSVFENSFLSTLLKFNKKYGAKFTLYCFDRVKSFDIEKMTDRYFEELTSADFIKFAYHGCFEQGNLIERFSLFNKNIERIGGKTSSTLRLHRFQANEIDISILTAGGVNTLLCADDDRINYSLSLDENVRLQQQRQIFKDGVLYRKSDLRLELARRPKQSVLDLGDAAVVFTHEWAFPYVRRGIFIDNILKKMEIYLAYFQQLEYEFIF
ncbi:MAG: hypothetical protein LBJ36_01200 [Synergistaceae bacterium]|jgi:hypothetical protein|nr:hypothetical protein [Synergistaceae bacterium]